MSDSIVWITVQAPEGEKHLRPVPADWTVLHLKEDLIESGLLVLFDRYDISFNGRVLNDDDTILHCLNEDRDPLLLVVPKSIDAAMVKPSNPSSTLSPAHVQASTNVNRTNSEDLGRVVESKRSGPGEVDDNISVKLSFDDGNVRIVQAATVQDIKTSAISLCRERGMILDDITLGTQSILNFGGKVLLKDLFSSDTQRDLTVLEVSHLSESSDESEETMKAAHQRPPFSSPQPNSRPLASEAFADLLFDAQMEKERLNHVNHMAYNGKLLTLSLIQLAEQVQSHYPSLQQEFLSLIQHHQEATDLLHQALERNAHFREALTNPSVGASRTTVAAASAVQQHLQPEQPAAQNQQQPGPVAPPQPRRFNGAGVAARIPRVVPALIVIDVRLLFKLALVVALLGHDAGQTEFYLICLIALLVYLANTNMLRIPFLARFLNMIENGRIPHAGRRGFFVDLWTLISSFFLSIIPAWQVLGEEVPVDQQQVRPVDANQPVVV